MSRTSSRRCPRAALLGVMMATVGLGLAACGGDDGDGGDGGASASAGGSGCPETIKIGGHTTSSGGAAVYGESFEAGIDLWVEDTNRDGGILGSQVSVTYSDDGFVNSRGGTVATELTARGDADFVLGPVSPGPAAVAAPVYDRAGVLALAPTTAGPGYATDGSVRNSTMYSTAAAREVFMEVVGEYIKAQGHSKPGLLVSQDTYGPPYQESTETAFEKVGLEVAAVEGFDVATTDLVSQVRALRDAGVDVVVPLTVATATFANFFRALERIDWQPPIAGPYALGSAPWGDFEGAAENAAFAEYAAATREGSTPASDLSARVGAALKEVPVFDYGIEAYLAGEVLEAAITEAGSCETEAVIEALTGAGPQTVMGQEVNFPDGARLGGTTASLRMVRPLTSEPETGLLEVVEGG
jgi:branched-chain amino acid transport system substrate-binding protein